MEPLRSCPFLILDGGQQRDATIHRDVPKEMLADAASAALLTAHSFISHVNEKAPHFPCFLACPGT